MLEFCKKILNNVSFDKKLFKKELSKSIGWLTKKETLHLKIWSLTVFANYRKIIIEVFDSFN